MKQTLVQQGAFTDLAAAMAPMGGQLAVDPE
jgi:hypothetical protein